MLAASRIVVTAGAKLFEKVCPTRIERGMGQSHVERLNKARLRLRACENRHSDWLG